MPDPFDTLGVEARFDLDRADLEERHRMLSGMLHPDRYSGKPSGERRLALDKAIAVNAAFRALKDPVRRAEALLARSGVETGEQVEPKASPELLMEMMEIREALAEARSEQDVATIGKLGDRMRKKEKELLSQIGERFGEANGDGEQLKAVLPLLGELRYVRRFFEELEAIEEELLD